MAKIAHIAVLIGSGLIIRDSQRLYIVCIFTFFPLVFSDRSQMFMSDCPADYVRIPAYSTRHTFLYAYICFSGKTVRWDAAVGAETV